MSSKEQSQAESNILTFLRVKPSKEPSGYFSTDELNPESIMFTLPDNFKSDYVNNTKLRHGYHFNGIIGANATQDDVFKKVGMAAVNNALEGFNSTIFAYGQTGSGKTFTLTGGVERFVDRGIIPRAISMVFKEFSKRTTETFKLYISYMELYNDEGYDLLDKSQSSKTLEELPKVQMLDDEFGNIHLKNLSLQIAETEEDALNLLFHGDTNRAIAETPMNLASSRSHCIFTMSIESRSNGSDRVKRSKLHLVDLAGSERVAKTNSSGSVLNEAKYINQSLFYLEMVIVALYEKATKGREHVPYRNSMMTKVLRDSLGGNCKTIMIATINPEASHTEESLSTCKFAQRVSLIKNKALINEEVDPVIIIKKLRAELLKAKDEIAFLKGESGEGEVMSLEEIETLKTQCKQYVDDTDPEAVLGMGQMTLTKIKNAFAIMKNLVLTNTKTVSRKEASYEPPGGASEDRYLRQISDLKSLLLQRDSEINILVNMVKKGKTVDDVGAASHAVRAESARGGGRDGEEDDVRRVERSQSMDPNNKGRGGGRPQPPQPSQQEIRDEKIIQRHLFGVPPPDNVATFEDAAASFEWFRARSALDTTIKENAALLRERIDEAKAAGDRAKQSRETANYLKKTIENVRREKALQSVASGSDDNGEESTQEATFRVAMKQERVVYDQNMDRLRDLKPEIDHLKLLIEKNRATLQNQFDQWYNNLHSRGISALSSAARLHAASESKEYSYGNSSGAGGGSSSFRGSVDSVRGEDKTISSSSGSFRGGGMHGDEAKPVRNNGPSRQDMKDDADDVNEDLQAFYQAKQDLLKRRQS